MINFISNLIITFSGFYLFKLISPVYIIFILGIFFCLTIFIFKFKNFNDVIFNLFIVYLIYIILRNRFTVSSSNAIYNLIISVIFYLLSYTCISLLNTKQILKISVNFINFSTLLCVMEAVFRLMHPNFSHNDNFYAYKVSSLMYLDSNFVGLFIVSIYFFVIYLHKEFNLKLCFQSTVLFILGILTFSRASIISIVVFTIVILFKNKFRKLKTKYILTIIISCLVLGISIYLFKEDGSFKSKFYIFELTINYIKSAEIIEILFGVGAGNAIQVLGMGAHNFFITYMVETGILGLTLLLFIWALLLFKTKFKIAYVMFPFILNGMSLTGYSITYLYAIYAIIYILSKQEIKSGYKGVEQYGADKCIDSSLQC